MKAKKKKKVISLFHGKENRYNAYSSFSIRFSTQFNKNFIQRIHIINNHFFFARPKKSGMRQPVQPTAPEYDYRNSHLLQTLQNIQIEPCIATCPGKRRLSSQPHQHASDNENREFDPRIPRIINNHQFKVKCLNSSRVLHCEHCISLNALYL